MIVKAFLVVVVATRLALLEAHAFADFEENPTESGDINVADVVVRGPDWEWGDQDGGGDESKGIVVEILTWKGEVDPMKFGVRVVWINGDSNIYRWGAQDKYDLTVVGKVSKETATEMRDRFYETQNEQQMYQDLPISTFERDVLIDVFEQTKGPTSWTDVRGWEHPHDSDPCIAGDWKGVVCENGKVIALDLSNNGLEGKFSALPLKKLPGLRSLNLAGNRLRGAIPPDIAYLDNLQFLALDNNQLTSYIPDDIGRLSQLQWFSAE